MNDRSPNGDRPLLVIGVIVVLAGLYLVGQIIRALLS